jgi:hypothetical protein
MLKTTEFNVVVELETPISHLDDELTDRLVETTRDYHGSIGRSQFDRVEVVLTLEAYNVHDAIGVAWDLFLGTQFGPAVSVAAMTTEDFDKANDLSGYPTE